MLGVQAKIIDNGLSYHVRAPVEGMEIEVAQFFVTKHDGHYVLEEEELTEDLRRLHLHSSGEKSRRVFGVAHLDEDVGYRLRARATKYCHEQIGAGIFSDFVEAERGAGITGR